MQCIESLEFHPMNPMHLWQNMFYLKIFVKGVNRKSLNPGQVTLKPLSKI